MFSKSVIVSLWPKALATGQYCDPESFMTMVIFLILIFIYFMLDIDHIMK
jgi:hypothetical protein